MARVLIVGSGGREHALAKALSKSSQVKEIIVSPGNYGTSITPKTTNLTALDLEKIPEVDLVVVGNESYLAPEVDIATHCEKQNIPCFGPTASAARLETSKYYGKKVMKACNIPTPKLLAVLPDDEKETATSILLKHPFHSMVIKRDGLCAGKGVLVPKSLEDALEFCEKHGKERLLFEERVYGQEVTIMAFSDGYTVKQSVPAKDYKKRYDQNRGPNTGSMGSFAPYHLLSNKQLEWVQVHVLQKLVDHMREEEKTPFVGGFTLNLIVSPDLVQILEINTRLGDSETQVVFPLLTTDVYDLFQACVTQTLHELPLSFESNCAVIVNAVIRTYPESSKLEEATMVTGVFPPKDTEESHFIAAGLDQDQMICGGRVFGCVGIHRYLEYAIDRAYSLLGKYVFPDMEYRKDVGQSPYATRLMVIGSSEGQTLATLCQFIQSGQLHASIELVMSDQIDAPLLEVAATRKIPTHVLSADWSVYQKSRYLSSQVYQYGVDLIILLGFQSVLPPSFVYAHRHYIIGVSPSLFPPFVAEWSNSKHVFEDLIKKGVCFTGCTIHTIHPEEKEQKILVQKTCSVYSNDSFAALKDRVIRLQGPALMEAIQQFPFSFLSTSSSPPLRPQEGKSDPIYPVNFDIASSVLQRARPAIEATHTDAVIRCWGQYGGCFDFAPYALRMDNPILVSSTDSLGSKILLNIRHNRLETVGEDLVHHCINDILCMGAIPLFFLDYIASAKRHADQYVKIIQGIARACKHYELALIGGECAEIRDMYRAPAIDTVGFIVGVVERDNLIDGHKIEKGDRVFALPSSGFHTNGYTLVNEHATEEKADLLLTPHRCYLNDLKHRLNYIHGLVHITGGGLEDNPPRILSPHLTMQINLDRWTVPDEFLWIQRKTQMSDEEMRRVFNMGLGMLVIVPREHVDRFQDMIPVGDIVPRSHPEKAVIFVRE